MLVRLREVMEYAYSTSTFYRTKWDAAGLEPADITSFEAFEQVPVVTKAELRESQANHPPFGDYLCVPSPEIHHIHGTSGTTGAPTAFAIGRRDWEVIADNHARILWGMGVRPGDTVFVAALFSLYLGSWGALAGAERLRCRVLPFGAGAPGMTARAVTWLARTKPKAFYATPSYALRLAEVAESEGIDPREFGLQVMFFSGEPGASVPAVRDGDRGRVRRHGDRLRDDGRDDAVHVVVGHRRDARRHAALAGHRLARGLRPATRSATVPYGSEGTPVYTHLERTSQPMIRLRLERPDALGAGGQPLRAHLSAAAAGRLRPDRRHVPRSAARTCTRPRSTTYLREVSGYGGEHRIVDHAATGVDGRDDRPRRDHPPGRAARGLRARHRRRSPIPARRPRDLRVRRRPDPRARRAQIPARRRRTRARARRRAGRRHAGDPRRQADQGRRRPVAAEALRGQRGDARHRDAGDPAVGAGAGRALDPGGDVPLDGGRRRGRRRAYAGGCGRRCWS